MILVFSRLIPLPKPQMLSWLKSATLRLCCAVCLSGTLLLLTSCEEEKIKIEELEQEVSLLKNSLRDLKDRIQDESERTDNFTHRIETTEQQSKDALEQASNAVTQQSDRFKRVEEGMSQVAKSLQKRESLAYLNVGTAGHAPIRTGHGTFLVQLDKLEPSPGGGSVAHIQIGNSLGLTVQQFDLKGDFGSRSPQLMPGEKYDIFSQRLDDWQKTLTPFEVAINTELQPNQWTKASFKLPVASNKSPIELLRLSMSIKRAYLSEKEKLSEFAITSIDSKAALMLKSPYGSFLFTIDSSERREGGILINARIGNPLGYNITQSELEGLFGPAPPTQTPGESPQNFSTRVGVWNNSLKPFKIPISTRLKPMLWTPVQFIMPADESHLRHIRVKFKVQRVSLSQERPR